MFSQAQHKKADKCKVTKIADGVKSIHFRVEFTDSKGEHDHQVSFDKKTKKMTCDCTWCSFYGLKKGHENKKCYNCLAVLKKLKPAFRNG